MKTPARLLVLALASLAACLVSTDELRPKTAADCGAAEKACGYKCVPLNDAATGCGDAASCAPVDLGADVNHCGACGHWCVGACSFGTCAPEALVRGAGELRGIAARSGGIYWLESSSGGRLVSWAPWIGNGAFAGANVTVLATGLDPRSGSPSLNRIAASPLRGMLYVVGSTLAVESLTLFGVDPVTPGAATRVDGDVLAPAGVVVDGVAATADAVYYARSDQANLAFWDFTGGAGSVATGAAAAGDIRGLAASSPHVYYGHPAAGGTIARASAGAEEIVRTGAGGVPHRLAVYEGASTEVYWESEVDGSVRYLFLDGVPTTGMVYPGPGVAGAADIAADGGGVYWTDRSTGEVWEWRIDGAVFQLAGGVAPVGIATDGTYVYWTDDAGYVMRVPR